MASESIVCPKCNKRSYSAGDVKHRFCIDCGYHDDIHREMKRDDEVITLLIKTEHILGIAQLAHKAYWAEMCAFFGEKACSAKKISTSIWKTGYEYRIRATRKDVALFMDVSKYITWAKGP